MRSKKHYEWLENIKLLGFEGEDGDTDDNDDSGDSDNSGDDDHDDDSGDSSDEGDTSGLKSALRKERKARRLAEKEAKRLAREKDDKTQSEQDELSKAQTERDQARASAQALADSFAKVAVESAIAREAVKMNFVDADDAVELVDRDLIDVDQEDDDPSSVQLDKESVTDALKALAAKKPHLLVAEGDQQVSGSKFGGTRKKKTESDEERTKRETAGYPAMRNRR